MQQMRQIRELIALAMLAISAYTDVREKNIYIMPLVISSAGAVLISVIQILAEGKGDVLSDKLILPFFAGIILTVLVYAWRQHIGMGDAYLLAGLGLVVGSRYCLYITAVALLITAIYAVTVMAALLWKGRNKRQHSIPFAPFVMAGFIMVLIYGI